MSAMVVAPGAAARQWTNKLGVMVVLAGVLGAVAGIAGALVSSTAADVPTGPAIVVAASLLVGLSLLFAPERGVVWDALRRRRDRHRLRIQTVLADLYLLAEGHDDPEHAHTVETLAAINLNQGSVLPSLEALERAGLARSEGSGWSITEGGRAEAARLQRTGKDPEGSGG
jgi:manganese/zinc/iron transport system permease protein